MSAFIAPRLYLPSRAPSMLDSFQLTLLEAEVLYLFEGLVTS